METVKDAVQALTYRYKRGSRWLSVEQVARLETACNQEPAAHSAGEIPGLCRFLSGNWNENHGIQVRWTCKIFPATGRGELTLIRVNAEKMAEILAQAAANEARLAAERADTEDWKEQARLARLTPEERAIENARKAARLAGRPCFR